MASFSEFVDATDAISMANSMGLSIELGNHGTLELHEGEYQYTEYLFTDTKEIVVFLIGVRHKAKEALNATEKED